MKKLMLTVMGIIALTITSVNAELLFYEGFQAAPGTVLGDLPTPRGGSGTWFDNSSDLHMTVRANGAPVSQLWTGIPSGGFPQTGGFLEGERVNDNEGHIQLATSVTSTFVDGAVTWMSFVAGPALETDQPDNHHKPNLAIGQGELMDDRAQQANGQAIGGGAAYSTQGLSATYWDDEDSSGNFEEHRSGGKTRITPQQLIVMKIEWGAASDTVSLANFDISTSYTALTEADFDAASPVSITSVNNFDQSTFDTLSFHGSRSNFDEIFIGTTFVDVIGGKSDLTVPDVDAGSDWITWSGEPVTLNDVLVTNNDPGAGDLTLTWSAIPVADVTVDFFDADDKEPTIKITKSALTDTATVVLLKLTVTQPGKEYVESSMTIDVYDDACRASLGAGKTTIRSGDFNANCITGLEDLAQMAAEWLVDFKLTDSVVK